MGANADLIKGAYAAFGRGDIPAIVDMVDDQVDWSSPRTLPQGGDYQGRDAVMKFFEAVGAAWETLSVEQDVVDEIAGDRVVGVVRLSGTLRGGKASGYGSVHVFDVRGNKIVRFREYVDVDQAITA
jgi:uncharacterized protein